MYRLRGRAPLLLVLLFIVSIAAAPPLQVASNARSFSAPNLARRDGHSHHSAPLTELNESEVAMYRASTPPSYWSIDIDDQDPAVTRYPGLMAVHVILMSLAFFIALPMSELHPYVSCDHLSPS
jgi:hypothetical protein